MISCLSTIPKVSDILYLRTNMKFTQTLIVWFFLKKIQKKKIDTIVNIIKDLKLSREKDDYEL